MKKLYLIRHAKSSWGEHGLADIERPLNKRGLEDAAKMGTLLMEAALNPDCVVASPARRCQETVKIIARKINFPFDSVMIEDRIYEATAHDLLGVIAELNNKLKTVVIFGHNPGITNLANTLTDVRIDSMPTCGIFAAEFNTKSWKKIPEKAGTFVSFDYPKKYENS